MREIDYAKAECERRHGRTNEVVCRNRKRVDDAQALLIELSGRSGNNGKVGVMQKELAEQKVSHAILEAKVESDHEVLAKFQLGQVKYSGLGGISGGGAVVGVIELLRYLF